MNSAYVTDDQLYPFGSPAPSSLAGTVRSPPFIPGIGGHHEVEQQANALLHVDLVRGGQPLVELVVDGGQDGLQARDADLRVVLQRVQPVVPERLDHVPHVHQVH